MTDTRKTVFLTGATGNMGREALKRLALRAEIRLRLLVLPHEKKHPVVREVIRHQQAEIVWGDLTDPGSMADGVRGADVVLHVGGLVSPMADHLPYETVEAVNVGGALNIVNAIKAAGDEARTRLVYIGTVAQTGSRNAPIHWGRTGDPIKISHFDHYAVTKTRAEAVVAESGLHRWVSLRQSGIAHFDMWRIFDPIMFHNPINGVFEWTTANDSGRLMEAVCGDAVPENFWRGFYNIGGGAKSRLTNHDFMERSMAAIGVRDYRAILKPNWFGTRNFHGQWYSDSDRLEGLVPFREQSIATFLKILPSHIPRIVKLVGKMMPGMLSKRIEALAKAPGGSLHWISNGAEDKIRAYFGSLADWRSIPDRWEDFVYSHPSSDISKLDHGYDESIDPMAWSITDLRQAASYRGGSCLADRTNGPYEPVEWQCARSHRFDMTPNLMLKGGHWCPICMIDPNGYHEVAAASAYLRQVCRTDVL